MEFKVNLDLYLLDKLERERSVSWYTPILDTKVTLTLAPGGVDPVVAENEGLKKALNEVANKYLDCIESLTAENRALTDMLERVRRDLLNEQGDPAAYGMAIINEDHPYHERLNELNTVLGHKPLDVS